MKGECGYVQKGFANSPQFHPPLRSPSPNSTFFEVIVREVVIALRNLKLTILSWPLIRTTRGPIGATRQ